MSESQKAEVVELLAELVSEHVRDESDAFGLLFELEHGNVVEKLAKVLEKAENSLDK